MKRGREGPALGKGGGRSFDALARCVIMEVRNRPVADAHNKIEAASNWLTSVVLEERFNLDAAREGLLARNITDPETFERVICSVSANLGTAWRTDERGFAEVSVASARLQSLCGALAPAWSADLPDAHAKSFLIAACEGEDHILGAVLTASRLRRLGHITAFALGASATDLIARLRAGNFDVLLVSSSCSIAFPRVVKTLDQLRDELPKFPALVVGGSALDHVSNVKEKTGADLVTKDIDVVLDWLDAYPFSAARKAAE